MSCCSVRIVVLAVCKSYAVVSGLGLFLSCPEKQGNPCEQLASHPRLLKSSGCKSDIGLKKS